MLQQEFATADLYDAFESEVGVCDVQFHQYGGRRVFAGPVRTVSCFEDNSRVRDLVGIAGEGAVLVVDGGRSTATSLLGDQLAAKASSNGWAGLVILGAVRDVDVLGRTDLGVKALGSVPRKTVKRDRGEVDVPVELGGVRVAPGDQLFSDADGILVANPALGERMLAHVRAG